MALLYGFYSFDRIVTEQYKDYRLEWERAGKPHGIFWRHSEGSGFSWLFSSSLAANRLTLGWLFKPPDWVKQSATAQVWLRRYRFATLVWITTAFVAMFMEFYRLSQG